MGMGKCRFPFMSSVYWKYSNRFFIRWYNRWRNKKTGEKRQLFRIPKLVYVCVCAWRWWWWKTIERLYVHVERWFIIKDSQIQYLLRDNTRQNHIKRRMGQSTLGNRWNIANTGWGLRCFASCSLFMRNDSNKITDNALMCFTSKLRILSP